MRVIVILFLGIAVIALVLKYFPDSEEGALGVARAAEAEAPVSEPPTGPRVLERPSSPPRGDREERTAPREAELEESGQEPRSLQGRLAPSPTRTDHPELAGALLHLDSEGFRAFLRSWEGNLGEDRQRLLLAFALAADGRPEEALALGGDLQSGGEIEPTEFELLEAAVGGSWKRAREASFRAPGARGSVASAMALRLLAREGERHLVRKEWKAAAEALSTVLLEDLRAPWTSDSAFLREWADNLNAAQEQHRWNPRGEWPSVQETVQPGDSLSIVRSRVVQEVPGLLVCTGLIARVNRIGDRYLQPGEELRIPTDPVSTLVDLDGRHLVYLFGDEVAAVWPVAIGGPGNETPEGEYVVGELIEEPPWFRPGGGTIPYGDPENELGTRWIGWDDAGGKSTSFGFHGTWQPETIGQAVSDGCIRLTNDHVEELFRLLPRGTTVIVQQ